MWFLPSWSRGKTRLSTDSLNTYCVPALFWVMGDKVPALRNRQCESFRRWCLENSGVLGTVQWLAAMMSRLRVRVLQPVVLALNPGSPTCWLGDLGYVTEVFWCFVFIYIVAS